MDAELCDYFPSVGFLGDYFFFSPFFGDRGGVRNGIERHKIGHEHFVVCKYGP